MKRAPGALVLIALALAGGARLAAQEGSAVIELPGSGTNAARPVAVAVEPLAVEPLTIELPAAPAVPPAWKASSEAVVTAAVAVAAAAPGRGGDRLRCGNWIYAGSKSSVCFSSKFLSSVASRTRVEVDGEFTPVKLSTDAVFEYPFAVMTGEGSFTLLEEERRRLKAYLERGGFLLASAGCSSAEWARAFQAEMKRTFPDVPMAKIPMDHPLFRTVFEIATINLKNGGTTLLEGLELNGRMVVVYSSEGLNDTSNVKGCCCCGGNEVRNSHDINVNIFAYAVMH